MEEIILSAVAEGIFGMLASHGIQEIGLLWDVNDDLEQLRNTVSAINAVLLDAEKKQNHNHQVKFWLQRLQEVVIGADDLVDDLSYEALRKSLMPGSNSMVKQLCTFFSSFNQIIYRHKMGHKIKNVRRKLAAIGNDAKLLDLEERHGETHVVTRLRDHTYSYVYEKEVIGRDDDRIAILQLLLDTKTKENVSIIPIVGIGGIGKTTLAQLVFNDKQVQKHFDLRLWVCVSDNFDVKLLVEKIIKSANVELNTNKEIEQLQQILREKINGKRYLLVLDDIWNEEQEKWNYLKRLLLNGGTGSKVIVTTRSKVVERITGTMPAYGLKVMDEEKSWALFKKIALKQEQESNISSKISEIGRHIVDKCGGIPLAIRTIGGMLRLKNPETEWSSFMEKELSKIPQGEDDIIPTLKLSYYHLPSNLKQCFAYYSLFPKDYVIVVENLVHHWMAQGFIKISNPTDYLEDVGYEYFKELLWRSFFEEVETDENGNVTKCKMHDLMHDLAESITRSEFDRRKGSTEPINGKTRHVLLYEYDSDLVEKIQPSLIQAKKMRTILMPNVDRWRSGYTITDGESTCEAIALNLKLLRTLDLRNFGIGKVPKSIGKLKHLRYLDLSFNGFKVLPDCVTRLHNLQTLNLVCCSRLQVLPKDINKLIKLQSLNIEECRNLKYLPRGIGELSSLRKLSRFTLSKGTSFFSKHQRGGGLDELRRLNNLRGSLVIENLRIDVMVQPKDANLKEKQHLRSLSLGWIKDVKLEEITEAVAEGYEMQLEVLQLHPNLKDLCIRRYQGVRFPSWIDSHTNMVTLALWKCHKCQHLPSLHQLPCLKELRLYKLDALEYVSKDEYLSCSSSSSSTLIFFPSLERLELKYLPNLKGWWRRSDSSSATASSSHDDHMLPVFPNCLSHLIIMGCPSLTCMPLFPYVSEDVIWSNSNWIPFQQTILSVSGGGARPVIDQPSSSSSSTSSYYSPLCKLTSLAIHSIHDLQFLPDELKSLTSLKDLHIGNCQEFKSLYPGIQHLTSLQYLTIENCKKLDMCDDEAHAITMWQQPLRRLQTLSLHRLPQLVDLPGGLQQLTSLQKLEISDCQNLVSLSEWIKSLTSLQYLKLYGCPKLASLPEEITSLTSLRSLEIQFCDALLPRCEREKGEDWPKISLIPDLRIH
ncbi:disease resistance protein RGA2-like [Ziziphus jujuba]|uniref:Disease resistance protein RGA2-like n=1 Tax=Ziziphus jujuba TaxID=326968 RepID=A0ABM3IIK0_ZIZJJ|nr:disease resistance protein RGA2-like [Ziziphus jujuba]